MIYLLSDGLYRTTASFGFPPEYKAFIERNPITPSRGTLTGRTVIDRCAVHIEDAAIDPEYTWTESQQRGNLRTLLGVPLFREHVVVGVIALGRPGVERFTEKQIALVTTFADQAVIAMENARLLTDTREALEQQTATAEVLQTINSSPGDLAPVFDAMLEKATRLCDAACGVLRIWDGEHFHIGAVHGEPQFSDWLRQRGPSHHFSPEPRGVRLRRRPGATKRSLNFFTSKPR